jgi:hypothetical protein
MALARPDSLRPRSKFAEFAESNDKDGNKKTRIGLKFHPTTDAGAATTPLLSASPPKAIPINPLSRD